MKNKLILGGAILLLLALAFWRVDKTAETRGRAEARDSVLVATRAHQADSIHAAERDTATAAAAVRARTAAANTAARKSTASVRVSDSLATVVRVTGPGVVTIHDTAYVVPPEVTARLTADSAALADQGAALVAARAESAALRVQVAASERVATLWAQADSTDRARVQTVEVAAYARGRGRGRLDVVAGLGGVVALAVGVAAALK